MDFRPLGDGMSCVAVAMPHAALEEGTTDAAPELRRICAVVGGGHDGTKKEARLQIGCLSLQTTMLARLSGDFSPVCASLTAFSSSRVAAVAMAATAWSTAALMAASSVGFGAAPGKVSVIYCS